MRNRLIIVALGVGIGVALKFLFPPAVDESNNPPRGGQQHGGAEDPAGQNQEDERQSFNQTPANKTVVFHAGQFQAEDPLVPPLKLAGLPISHSRVAGTTLLAADLLNDFSHDPQAHFHPHGPKVCSSGCAASNHPTAELTADEFHSLMTKLAQESWSDESSALAKLLYYGRQARAMVEQYGTGPLDSQKALQLSAELARTHARVSIRVVDEHGDTRAWIDAARVPLDRRHVFEMQTNGLQPLVTSGTVKRTGLDHLWTRL